MNKTFVDFVTKYSQIVWAFIVKYAKIGWAEFLKMLKRGLFAFQLYAHPVQGFYDLKNDKRRKSIPAAVMWLVLLGISAVARSLMTGYLFSESEAAKLNMNIPMTFLAAILPYILFSVSNWCFTSLMDGDGKLSEIFTATAFATVPITICNIIAIPVSNYASLSDTAIYSFILGAGTTIAYLMIFVGMITTHQYSVGKGLVTMILTIVGMAVIAFVAILVFFLIQQIASFIDSIVTEFNYRINE